MGEERDDRSCIQIILDQSEKGEVADLRRPDVSAPPEETNEIYEILSVSSGEEIPPEKCKEFREVSADALRSLILRASKEKMFTRRGIHIRHARIKGDLNLYNLRVRFPLRFQACCFEGLVELGQARLRSLELTGSCLQMLRGNGLRVTGNLKMSHCISAGPIVLEGARISGWADFRDAQLLKCGPWGLLGPDWEEAYPKHLSGVPIPDEKKRYAEFRYALVLSKARVGNDVSLERCRTQGPIMLDGMEAGRHLTLVEAKICGHPNAWPYCKDETQHEPDKKDREAINADGILVGGDADWSCSGIRGPVTMVRSQIAGTLRFTRMCLKGVNGRSLILDRSDIKGDLLFGERDKTENGGTATIAADQGSPATNDGTPKAESKMSLIRGAIRIRKVQIGGILALTDTYVNFGGYLLREEFGGISANDGRSSEVGKGFAGTAIIATGAQIGSDLFIRNANLVGALELANVVVQQSVIVDRIKFRRPRGANTNPSHVRDSIIAPHLRVGSDAKFHKSHCIGKFTLKDAEIDGSLIFDSGCYKSIQTEEKKALDPSDDEQWEREKRKAIFAQGAVVGHRLLFRNGVRVDGLADFASAMIEDEVWITKAVFTPNKAGECLRFLGSRVGRDLIIGDANYLLDNQVLKCLAKELDVNGVPVYRPDQFNGAADRTFDKDHRNEVHLPGPDDTSGATPGEKRDISALFLGRIVLASADIGGFLRISSAHIEKRESNKENDKSTRGKHYPFDQAALNARFIRVGRGVHDIPYDFERSATRHHGTQNSLASVYGEVWFDQAEIGGALALHCTVIISEGSKYERNGTRAGNGAIPSICDDTAGTGNSQADNGEYRSGRRRKDNWALHAAGIRIASTLYLGERFVAVGRVDFTKVTIGASFECGMEQDEDDLKGKSKDRRQIRGATLINEHYDALILQHATIGRNLDLKEHIRIVGGVDLSDAQIEGKFAFHAESLHISNIRPFSVFTQQIFRNPVLNELSRLGRNFLFLFLAFLIMIISSLLNMIRFVVKTFVRLILIVVGSLFSATFQALLLRLEPLINWFKLVGGTIEKCLQRPLKAFRRMACVDEIRHCIYKAKAKFALPGNPRTAPGLNAKRLVVKGPLEWLTAEPRYKHRLKPWPGHRYNIDLSDASAGHFRDHVRAWPKHKCLQIIGFRYRALDPESADISVKKRYKYWLLAQKEASGDRNFSAQPYEELAGALRKLGRANNAEYIDVRKNDRMGTSNSLLECARRFFLGWGLRYGYQPLRAVAVILVFWVLGSIIFGSAHLIWRVKYDRPLGLQLAEEIGPGDTEIRVGRIEDKTAEEATTCPKEDQRDDPCRPDLPEFHEEAGKPITIGEEIMTVTSAEGMTLTVERGEAGTSKETHKKGAPVRWIMEEESGFHKLSHSYRKDNPDEEFFTRVETGNWLRTAYIWLTGGDGWLSGLKPHLPDWPEEKEGESGEPEDDADRFSNNWFGLDSPNPLEKKKLRIADLTNRCVVPSNEEFYLEIKTKDEKHRDKFPVYTTYMEHSPKGYPRFVAWRYSLDTVLPLVDLRQENYWIPASDPHCELIAYPTNITWETLGKFISPGNPFDLEVFDWKFIESPFGVLFYKIYLTLHIVVGWVFATLFLAAITGFIRPHRPE